MKNLYKKNIFLLRVIGHPKIIKLKNIFEYKQLLFLIMEKIKKNIIVTKIQQKQIKTAYYWGKQKQNKKFFIKHMKNQKKFRRCDLI